ncbi:hypothetical protein [Streptomyces sp. NPDC127119]|uniref:hypothetical protein n=1 Tax=Streptomyces sp. NPDC127119 TaxID=3345370 RepID=UPI0036327753
MLAEVERHARTLNNPQERATLLAGISADLVKHDPGRAMDLMTEAERILADVITDPFSRWLKLGEALTAMAVHAPDAVKDFVDAMTGDADPDQRTSTLTFIAGDLAESAPGVAEHIAYAINAPDGVASLSMQDISKALAASDPDAAERIARAIPDPKLWGPALCTIAQALMKKAPGRSRDLLAEAEQLIRTQQQPTEQVTNLSAVAEVLARFDPEQARGLLVEAEHVVRGGLGRDTLDAWVENDAFRRDGPTLAKVWTASALLALAAGWAEVAPDRAVELLTEVDGSGADLTMSTPKIEDTVRTLARRDSAAAVHCVSLLSDPYDRKRAMEDIIGVVAGHDPPEAERIARGIPDPAVRCLALKIVVEALAQRDLSEAERVARSISEPAERIHMLGLLATMVP